jgi:HK97 family phage major capsid protein
MKTTEAALKDMVREVVTEVVREKDFKEEGHKNLDQAVDAVFAEGEQKAHRIAAQKKRIAALHEDSETAIMGGRFLRAIAAGKGDSEKAARFAAKQWGSDDPIVKVLEASDWDAAGVLVPTEYSSELIELLREVSVVRAAGPRVIPMETGSIQIPKQTSGASGSYLGESQNISMAEPAFGSIKLVWKKLGCMVALSNDLLRYAAFGADAIARDDAVFGIRETEEVAFLRSMGTEHTPKGLLYWCPAENKANVTGSYDLAKVTADLANTILKLRNGLCRMISPVWFFAPRTEMYLMTVRDSNGNFAYRDEMLTGRLWGFPFFSTTNIPINLGSGDKSEIYLVDMADVILGESNFLEVDASNTAAYDPGSGVVSSFQKDQTLIRVIAHHDLGVRHEQSLAILEAVDWVPVG